MVIICSLLTFNPGSVNMLFNINLQSVKLDMSYETNTSITLQKIVTRIYHRLGM